MKAGWTVENDIKKGDKLIIVDNYYRPNHVRNLGFIDIESWAKDEHTAGTWQPKGTKNPRNEKQKQQSNK